MITVHDLRARVPMALARGIGRTRRLRFSLPQGVSLKPPLVSTNGSEPPKAAACDLLAILRLVAASLPALVSADSPVVLCPSQSPSVKKVSHPDYALDSYWTPREEAEILSRLVRLLTHPNLDLEGQNFIYDTQYISHHWGVTPNASFDSMYAWHVCFPGTPKALDYLSSLFCRYHRYWKEDHKDWDLTSGDLGALLRYNAEDCVRTYECCTAI